ncbi:BrnT family toxin [Testudinibacter sp. P80/BLE/0925]|uniref:BrnT family toxin n=1 Tax=Testudinibacter sp. TW-1 TaxID=3417757 RepID=UPI003D36F60E
MSLLFEWDINKAKSNIKKHGITFEEAAHVFSDPNHLSIQDRIENGEYRWQTMGLVAGCLLILVAHTLDSNSNPELIRIISARRATKKEKTIYEQNLI